MGRYRAYLIDSYIVAHIGETEDRFRFILMGDLGLSVWTIEYDFRWELFKYINLSMGFIFDFFINSITDSFVVLSINK